VAAGGVALAIVAGVVAISSPGAVSELRCAAIGALPFADRNKWCGPAIEFENVPDETAAQVTYPSAQGCASSLSAIVAELHVRGVAPGTSRIVFVSACVATSAATGIDPGIQPDGQVTVVAAGR